MSCYLSKVSMFTDNIGALHFLPGAWEGPFLRSPPASATVLPPAGGDSGSQAAFLWLLLLF